MQEDILIQISNRIKERRREIGITVQELADKANVSKGLISQIENSRTIPSLIVLINIIKALQIDLNAFFQDISNKAGPLPILIKRREEYQYFEKEQAEGFKYHRIFTESFNPSTVDIVILELEPGASRPMVQTEAFEYKYIISGNVDYHFAEERITLNEGDSILFDGRTLHTPLNKTDQKVTMLVIYFFEESK